MFDSFSFLLFGLMVAIVGGYLIQYFFGDEE